MNRMHPSPRQSAGDPVPTTQAAVPRQSGNGSQANAYDSGRPLRTTAQLIQLQKVIGNRAVAQMLHSPPGKQEQSRQAAQRKIVSYNENPGHALKDGIVEFAKEMDKAVERAWTLVVSRPLKAEEIIDGYTERWAKEWRTYLDSPTERKTIGPMVPAMVGYAVESLATKLFIPAPGDGLSLKLQATRGNTRPDIVLTNIEDKDVAWFDITASASEGHIKEKDGGGWTTMPFVLEFSYPSVSADEIFKEMVAFESSGKELSTDDVKERYWLNRAKWEAKRAIWIPLIQGLVEAVKDELYVHQRRDKAREILQKLLKAELVPRDVASILQFCGLNIKTYGFAKPNGDKFFGNAITASDGGAILQHLEDALPQPSEEDVANMLKLLRSEKIIPE